MHAAFLIVEPKRGEPGGSVADLSAVIDVVAAAGFNVISAVD